MNPLPPSRPRVTATLLLALQAAALLALSGCFDLRQKPLEKHYFVIDVERPGDAETPLIPAAADRILSVRKFRVSPHYEGKGLVYREGEAAYRSDFYNEYFISTHAMFTEETRQWLAASGLFAHVVDTSSRMDATHVLEGSVTTLLGDFTDPKSPKAVLDIQLLLMEDTGVDPKILASKTYKVEIPLDRRSPEALVAGLTKALERSLTRFESDLREVLNRG